MSLPLKHIFKRLPIPPLRVVDVGASAIDGPPAWAPLEAAGDTHIVGFEPDATQFNKLQEKAQSHTTWLPYAIGDGSEGLLRVCRSPGMTSLLEPDFDVLQHFHGFPQWAEVVDRIPLKTHRLDTLAETEGMDFLKVDVQGGELEVLRGAEKRLEETLAVQLEVNFVPFYKEQPTFAILDTFMRERGFVFHSFTEIHKRVFKPMLLGNDPYAGVNQTLWSDAIYFRDFTSFSQLDETQLLKIARLSHELYGSIDLCALALEHLDKLTGRRTRPHYINTIAAALSPQVALS